MQTKDFYYDLPEDLIAQHPSPRRDHSRLLHLGRYNGSMEDLKFYQILDLLKKGDTLVINDTRVLPARLFGSRPERQEKIEILLLKETSQDIWECLVKPGRKMKLGTEIIFSPKLKGRVVAINDSGQRQVYLQYQGIFQEILEELGEMPLPPYIRERLKSKDRYQTVYAREAGSAAAPTAGLHFTREILGKLKEKGVIIVPITLHVGLGTFRPVKVVQVEAHKMHSEFLEISEKSARIINETKSRGGRVIAVGTTSVRTLESRVNDKGEVEAGYSWTDIFIYPGYQFKIVDGIITNFHLPESTLIMLVSAFSNRDNIMKAYQHAVKKRYRFFSFGDAMFIE